GCRRAALMHVLPKAIQAAGELQGDRRHGQKNFFDTFESSGGPEATAGGDDLPDIPERPASEKLRNGKEALHFHSPSQPLAQHEELLNRFSTHQVADIRELPANQEVLVGGMMTQVRLMNTKKARNGNTRYARFKLEDFHGAAECVMWPDDYTRFKDHVKED